MSFFTLVPLIGEYQNFLIFSYLTRKLLVVFFFLSKLLVSILCSVWTGLISIGLLVKKEEGIKVKAEQQSLSPVIRSTHTTW